MRKFRTKSIISANHLLYNMPIVDYQVFIALFLALATGIFAVRLGVALYK
jgi:photosystem I reaction center subunit XII